MEDRVLFVFPPGSWYEDDQHLLGHRGRPQFLLARGWNWIGAQQNIITVQGLTVRKREVLFTRRFIQVLPYCSLDVLLWVAFTAVVKKKYIYMYTDINISWDAVCEHQEKGKKHILYFLFVLKSILFLTIADEGTAFLRRALDYFQSRKNTYH